MLYGKAVGKAMYKCGDYILYNSQYVCLVEDICEEDTGEQGVSYYVLRPVYERNTIIRIPVNSTKVTMRYLISPDEARAVIQSMPDIMPEWIEDKNQRAQAYREALRSGQCERWVMLTKTLFQRKSEVAQIGKRLSASDEQTLKSAERLLHGELAITLGIAIDDVADYILDEISHGELCQAQMQ